MLVTVFILITLVALPICVAIILMRTWVLERSGVDIDNIGVSMDNLERLNDRQKLILALLLVPPVLIMLFSALYIMAGAVVTLSGVVLT